MGERRSRVIFDFSVASNFLQVAEMCRAVLLRIGIRVDLLHSHDVVNDFLYFVRMSAKGRLQQLQRKYGRLTFFPKNYI